MVLSICQVRPDGVESKLPSIALTFQTRLDQLADSPPNMTRVTRTAISPPYLPDTSSRWRRKTARAQGSLELPPLRRLIPYSKFLAFPLGWSHTMIHRVAPRCHGTFRFCHPMAFPALAQRRHQQSVRRPWEGHTLDQTEETTCMSTEYSGALARGTSREPCCGILNSELRCSVLLCSSPVLLTVVT